MRKNDKTLIIVESPAKIKTISKILGPDYKIMSTFGHIKDLPEDSLGVEIDKDTGVVNLQYTPLKGKKSVITDICKQASQSDVVLLGSDNDREGEVISWHIAEEIKKSAKKAAIFRIVFNEITKPALEKAITQKSQVDLDKVYAQQARRVVDRWVGYEVSPILWRKLSKGLSAGRVQSAALLLICARDKEIQEFIPEESWSIHLEFESKKGLFKSELYKINDKVCKIKDKKSANEILEKIKQESSFQVSQITDKQRSSSPLAPFTTSTIQQDAFNKLGFSVDKTMTLAQKLYEGVPLEDQTSPMALITYMRSDSTRLSDTFLEQARKYIDHNFGDKYLPKKAVQYSKDGAQDAHEAIRPVSVTVTPDIAKKHLEKDLAKLYELIWRRSVACQMSPAVFAQRQILVAGGNFIFKATGSTLIFEGFLKTYKPEEDVEEAKSGLLPDLAEKTAVEAKKPVSKQHFTEPPPRYTQASIVKEMEKQGIGRPSTYANTISTILKREYVAVEKKKFFPTELGLAVTQMLSKNLPDIINVSFTAKMEADLDKIAAGKANKDQTLITFYKHFEKDLEKFRGSSSGGKEAIITELECPECKKQRLSIKFSRSGQFLGCPGYPECTFTANFARATNGSIKIVEKTTQVRKIDKKCPDCNNDLVERVGKFGPFISCSAFPKCKYILQEKMQSPCPLCGKDMIKKVWRKGVMWGCTGYPKCKNAIFGDIQETPCPKCKRPYLLLEKNTKSGVEKLVCSDKSCGFEQEAQGDRTIED
jgi:DNA topoisomerase-1